MYNSDFQERTLGPQIRIGYNFTEKMTTNLSYTMGMPIKQPSQVEMVDNNGNYSTQESEMVYKFKTFQLNAQRHFIGGNESACSFYGVVGVGVVIVSYKEEIKMDYDKNMYTPTDLVEKDSESGFTMNLGIGGQF